MDEATGLIYVGNGQYYDPETGRFLTRDARPNQNNPYTPIDPTSAMLAPLALLALVFGRKKSRGRWDMLVILLALSLSLGMGLAACDNTAPVTVTATKYVELPTPIVRIIQGKTEISSTAIPSATPLTPISICSFILDPMSQPPSIDGYDPTKEPSSISWYPRVNTPLSPGVPKNQENAQYYPYAGFMGWNLCGQIVLSMIAAGAGYGDMLYNIWEAAYKTEQPTDQYALLYAAIKSFPGNWNGKAYGWSQSYTLGTSDLSKIKYNPDGTLPNNWYFQTETFGAESWSGGQIDVYGKVAYETLYNKLAQNHNLVVLANLETSGSFRKLIPNTGTAHWVLITGLSAQWDCTDESSSWNWVRINNPYNNRVEYYPWKDFKLSISSGDAAGYVLVDLWK